MLQAGIAPKTLVELGFRPVCIPEYVDAPQGCDHAYDREEHWFWAPGPTTSNAVAKVSLIPSTREGGEGVLRNEAAVQDLKEAGVTLAWELH